MHVSCGLTRVTVPHRSLKSWSVFRDCDIIMLGAVDWPLVYESGISWSYLFTIYLCI